MRGQIFQSGYCMHGDIISTDLWGIFYMLIPHFPPQTINCQRVTPIYEKWHSPKSYKLQTLRQGKHKASSIHMPVINPINHWRTTVPVVNWRGLFNLFDYCTVPGQFSESCLIAVCTTMFLSMSPRDYYYYNFFICNFWISTISHK